LNLNQINLLSIDLVDYYIFGVLKINMNWIFEPWPWYVAGPLIGATVPLLLLLGNKKLGISSSLRHVCAALLPANISLFKYDWKKESWNLLFVVGLFIGGFIGGFVFANPNPVAISENTQNYLSSFGIQSVPGLMPSELFSWETLLSFKGFLMMVVGGFLVGFGTRYARGCTSGHGILGLSALQWPSLVATASFFGGGILFSKFILPHILAL
jgi:hypothetical protein